MARRRTWPLGLVCLLGIAPFLGAGPGAEAQGVEEVEGSADFRTAPFIGEGTYRDRIVTGETVWYSVLYTNHQDLHISASLAGVDADASEELDLYRGFVGPNLDELSSQTEDIGPGYTAWWEGGETETNVWFVAFHLASTGQRGVGHDLVFELDGVASADLSECGDDCTLDDDLDSLESDLADLESQIEECEECGGDMPDLDELETQRDDAQGDVEGEEAAISRLCEGAENCDLSTSSTPWGLVALLGATTLVAGGGAARSWRQRGRGGAPPAVPVGAPGSSAETTSDAGSDEAGSSELDAGSHDAQTDEAGTTGLGNKENKHEQ